MSDASVLGVRLHCLLDEPEEAPVIALVNSLGTGLTVGTQVAALAQRSRVVPRHARPR